ncbi:unnamed protein product [Periconia digitata]|uniref:Uncharacterized protein n=1 Tax=Periconia digitata TaxID=1303443 RepID=A0A9W4XNH8_9PLEO|nr:unnamed protein product [Periconia digitata]
MDYVMLDHTLTVASVVEEVLRFLTETFHDHFLEAPADIAVRAGCCSDTYEAKDVWIEDRLTTCCMLARSFSMTCCFSVDGPIARFALKNSQSIVETSCGYECHENEYRERPCDLV